MGLLKGFLAEASKYGELVRPDTEKKGSLICKQICPYCEEKLRWHLPDGLYGRVFFVCDKCDKWFFVVGAYGAWGSPQV